ncbi:MAG: hypothetical protein LBT04_08900 [Prevotellaceae bacterium]|nr:hypothetical protein [Prevotellaceae bacterium]
MKTLKYNLKMKSLYYLLIPAFMLAMASFSGCDRHEITAPDTLIGEWTLISVQGGFHPDIYYDYGEIKWNITNENTVIVENSSNNYPLPPVETDRYIYSRNGNIITLDNIFEYQFTINADTLLLKEGELAADGSVYTFYKFNNLIN